MNQANGRFWKDYIYSFAIGINIFHLVILSAIKFGHRSTVLLCQEHRTIALRLSNTGGGVSLQKLDTEFHRLCMERDPGFQNQRLVLQGRDFVVGEVAEESRARDVHGVPSWSGDEVENVPRGGFDLGFPKNIVLFNLKARLCCQGWYWYGTPNYHARCSLFRAKE